MIVHDDCRAVLPKLHTRSVDAVVCDPPYELKRDREIIGIERESIYAEVAKMRVNHAYQQAVAC